MKRNFPEYGRKRGDLTGNYDITPLFVNKIQSDIIKGPARTSLNDVMLSKVYKRGDWVLNLSFE